MTRQQRDTVAQILRNAPVDLGGEVDEQRQRFRDMVAANPAPTGVTVQPLSLGGVPALAVEGGGTAERTVLYFHGGCFVVGSALASLGLAANLAVKAHARVVSVDYRLAPEHPSPAALHDALSAYRALIDTDAQAGQIAVAGESAGANLAVALMLAARSEPDLPLPACAVLLSPWADLTVPDNPDDLGLDPVITPAALRTRARDYLNGTDPRDGLVSPLHADLSGLPPLLIQAGSHEYLLDDALRLAARAATDHVPVTLDVTPQVLHVFQAFAAILDEGDAALTRAAAFLASHTTS